MCNAKCVAISLYLYLLFLLRVTYKVNYSSSLVIIKKKSHLAINCLTSHPHPHCTSPIPSLDQFFIEAISIWTTTGRPMYIFLEITAFSVHVLTFQQWVCENTGKANYIVVLATRGQFIW